MTALRRAVALHRNLAFGGAERVLVEQVRALGRTGCEVDAWATRADDPLDLEGELRAANPNVRRVGVRDGPRRVAWTLATTRYDLAITSIGRAAWKGLRLARRMPLHRRPAVIATLHGEHPEAYDPLRPFVSEVDLVLLMYDFREHAAAALHVPLERFAVALPMFPAVLQPTGPDADERARRLRASWGVQGGALVVGYLGRLAPEKGVAHVIRMVGRLVAAGRDLHLVVVGRRAREDAPDGRDYARLWDAAVAESPALRGRLHTPGPTPDPGSAYRAFDVSVLCSRHEGVGLTVFESLSVGTPVVVTGVGAIPKLLDDGVHAAIVARDPTNGKEPEPEVLAAFEARLAALVDDAALRRRLAAAGKARVESLVATSAFAERFRDAADRALAIRDERR